ncbi:hypothetical protein OSB04_017143 [Centaurea solstitialis]|uniref:GAG-pre-integrase domain-containing protein n=1 Tax=Centaurea solstitialis TaxID=347529 RepID=A0AA38T9Y2_9ASTR|nr:hypothetical protein OSB04_017143 [Centaurea solstitialis]
MLKDPGNLDMDQPTQVFSLPHLSHIIKQPELVHSLENVNGAIRKDTRLRKRSCLVTHAQAHTMAPTNASAPTTTNSLFDSGASFHATNDLNNLSIHAPYDGIEELVIGDGLCLQITHIGFALIHTPHTFFILKNVFYVPSFSHNIIYIYIYRLCLDNNFLIEFYSFVFVIKDRETKIPLFKGMTTKGLYELRSSLTSKIFTIHHHTNSSIWHHRLGHTQNKVLKHLSSIISFNSTCIEHCNSCRINKSHRLPFHDFIFNIKCSIRFNIFRCMLLPSRTQLFSDNGGEYIKLKTHLSSSGISQLSDDIAKLSKRNFPYSPMLTCRRPSGLLPSPPLPTISPYQFLFQKLPNYSKLKSFGCLCYPWLRPYSPHKLSSLFITYDLIRSKTYLSRHVIFIKHQLPFSTLTSTVENNSHLTHSNTWFTFSIPITSNSSHGPSPSSPCQVNSHPSLFSPTDHPSNGASTPPSHLSLPHNTFDISSSSETTTSASTT